MYNYVRRRMSNDPAVEDVVSEAYLHAARAFHTFDPSRAKFSTWVIKIAINCMNGYWRKERPVIALDEVPMGHLGSEEFEDEAVERELVDRLLEVLDQDERELILMKYRMGMRNVDIAHELGLNASTVSSRLARAIEKMRVAAEGGT